MKKPSIQQVDDFFPTEIAETISHFTHNGDPKGPGFRYGEGDGIGEYGEDIPTGLVLDLYHENDEEGIPLTEDGRNIYNSFIKHIHDRYPGFWDTYRVYRLYINVFAPREQAYFHTDSEGDSDQWTFLYYPIPDFEWKLNDGGWTEFDLDGKVIGVRPLPNSLVRFTSSINHRATPYRNHHRFTIAIKCVNKNER
jgi:hypothetical protein|tara:strand:- start:685 stop:1269 length:585 start_codon:yes stop_codon:yes gene_type:complete